MRTALVRTLALTALLAAAAGCSTPAASEPGPTSAASSDAGGSDGRTGLIVGQALAGPICPVEKSPPDPSCAPKPVAGAVVVVTDAAGTEVAHATTDADGAFSFTVPAGTYRVVGEEAQGLIGGPPPPVDVTVVAGTPSAPIVLAYDTGIR